MEIMHTNFISINACLFQFPLMPNKLQIEI